MILLLKVDHYLLDTSLVWISRMCNPTKRLLLYSSLLECYYCHRHISVNYFTYHDNDVAFRHDIIHITTFISVFLKRYSGWANISSYSMQHTKKNTDLQNSKKTKNNDSPTRIKTRRIHSTWLCYVMLLEPKYEVILEESNPTFIVFLITSYQYHQD
jgi:hypothetical protein